MPAPRNDLDRQRSGSVTLFRVVVHKTGQVTVLKTLSRSGLTFRGSHPDQKDHSQGREYPTALEKARTDLIKYGRNARVRSAHIFSFGDSKLGW